MIKIFDGEDKVYSTNGNLVVNPTLAKVHKADNGDFYLDLETPLIENEKERAAETGTYITGTSFTIQNYDSTKLVELTELDGNTTQSGTPTPDSPQPINVVSGGQEVDIYNNTNLFNIENNITNANIDSSGTIINGTYSVYYFEVNDTKKYRMTTGSSRQWVYSFYTEIPQINSTGYSRQVHSSLVEEFSIPQGYKYVAFRRIDGGGEVITNIQINEVNAYEINLGKNLLPNTNTTQVLNNITFTKNDDDSIKMNGTANANTSYRINTLGNELPLPAGTYTISTGNNLTSGITLQGWHSTATNFVTIQSSSNKASFTLTSDVSNVRFQIVIANGTQISNLTIYPMLEKGSQATLYSPYKTPIEICKINTYKDMIFKGKGINLFDNSTSVNGWISNGGTVIADTKNLASDFIKVESGKKYTISVNTQFTNLGYAYFDNNKTYVSRQNNNNTTNVSITIPDNVGYFRIWLNLNGATDLTTENILQYQPMINEGNQALPYEPYNSKGKWLLHKEIGKVVLNGSEADWRYSQGNQVHYTDKIRTIAKANTTYFCNYYTKVSNTTSYASMTNGTTKYDGTDNCRLIFKNTSITSVNDFKTWLGTHNTIVYYVLATPTTTEITDNELISQLEGIELLEGLNNVSVSSADLPGEITIHYNYLDGYKNITKYIDYLIPNNIIVANTPQGEQAFRITNVEKTRRKIKIKAYHVFYDSENLLIQDSYVVDKNCNDALDHLNNATSDLSPFTTISNINTIANYRCVRKSLYEAIQVVLERWGGHLVRDNWSIGIYDTIGQDNGVTIRYAKNLKEMTATYNWDEVVTKLMPVGKDGILLNEIDPDASVYVESATKYVIPYTKTISFQQDSIVEDDYKDEDNVLDEDAYKQALVDDLYAQATEYINNNYLPKVNYTLSANVEKISDVGDSIEVIDEKLGINIMTNIISYDYDCILNRYLNLEFGNFTPTLSGLMDTITNNTEKLIQEENSTLAITLGRELDEATSKIWGALGNSYVIYDGDKILVVDSLPKETATNVIMINNGGIGFSNTGITGTFSSAWTIDNVLNMENINVINLTADLVKGGTLKLGSNLNQNGKLEVYDEANNLIAELNKNGLKMYGVDGSYVLMNNQVGFAGYDRNDNPVYWVSKDEFHMKKSVVEEEITLVNKMRIIPITIMNGNTIVNDGIGFINVPN